MKKLATLQRTRTTGVSLTPYHRWILDRLREQSDGPLSDGGAVRQLIEVEAQRQGWAQAEFEQLPNARAYVRGAITKTKPYGPDYPRPSRAKKK